jgi:hypothetical protein
MALKWTVHYCAILVGEDTLQETIARHDMCRHILVTF